MFLQRSDEVREVGVLLVRILQSLQLLLRFGEMTFRCDRHLRGVWVERLGIDRRVRRSMVVVSQTRAAYDHIRFGDCRLRWPLC